MNRHTKADLHNQIDTLTTFIRPLSLSMLTQNYVQNASYAQHAKCKSLPQLCDGIAPRCTTMLQAALMLTTASCHSHSHGHWQRAINHQLLKRCLPRNSNNKPTFQRSANPLALPSLLHSSICVPPAAASVAAAATHVGRFKTFSWMTYFKRSANSCNSNTNQSWATTSGK